VIPRVPAVEIVAEPLARKGKTPVEAREMARDLLDRLGLPRELWDAFPATFSGGEQQRVNIARAIIAAPRFLLVDEPTASLDLKTKDVVIDLVLALKTQGASVVLITHDQHTLERMSDRRLHLEHGRVSEMVAEGLADPVPQTVAELEELDDEEPLALRVSPPLWLYRVLLEALTEAQAVGNRGVPEPCAGDAETMTLAVSDRLPAVEGEAAALQLCSAVGVCCGVGHDVALLLSLWRADVVAIGLMLTSGLVVALLLGV
jgi:energy-coupling factor transporter ATP-binding protein EcfA2